MSDETVSPLRRRMIEEMTIRQFSPKVQNDYLRHVKNFAVFLGRSPDKADFEDIRRYQLHLSKSGLGVPSRNVAMTALRFFFRATLNRPEVTDRAVFAREARRLPVVLSQEEVARFLAAAPNLKAKTMLTTAYATGLRVHEVSVLKVSDIDSERMAIRVEQGKGRKDRYVMLSPQLLELLRAYWSQYRPRYWLFPSPWNEGVAPLTPRQIRRLSFATHLLEHKTDIRVIQVLLGHKKLDTTALYTRVALRAIGEIISPLDLLPIAETRPPA